MTVDGPIALFLPSVRGGGAQRVVVNLAQGITERGMAVDVVLATAEGIFLDQLPSTVRLVDLRAGRLLRSLGPLTRYIRRRQPKALISSMSHANVIALWAAKLARQATPVVVTVHNTMSQASEDQGSITRRLWPPVLRTFYPWADSIVAVSRGAADDFARTSGLPRDRVEVVYNPVITPAIMALARQARTTPGSLPVSRR